MSHINTVSNLHLTERLSTVSSMVRPGIRLADIGTDHGLLPAWLLLNNKISFCLACDIREGPLESAHRTFSKWNIRNDRAVTRLSDGLAEVASYEADDIVIAGMGSDVICGILSACDWIKDPKKHLILQPMTGADAVRSWLWSNGFMIEKEIAAVEKYHSYVIISAYFCGEVFHPEIADLITGRLDAKLPESRFHLERLLKIYRRQQAGLAESRTRDASELDEIICALENSLK